MRIKPPLSGIMLKFRLKMLAQVLSLYSAYDLKLRYPFKNSFYVALKRKLYETENKLFGNGLNIFIKVYHELIKIFASTL